MASPASKFSLTSKTRPCAVCGNTTGHCKTKEGDRGDILHYCHNHPSKPQGPIAGHHYISAGGDWGVFSTEKPAKQSGTRTKAKSQGASKSVPLVSPADRDAAFRAYMSKLSLHADDRADLIRRGVTDDQIAVWGVVSIEGKEPGYIVPCYSAAGLIVGAQWRLRDASEGARYKWVSWIGGGSKNGEELPLTVHRPIGVEPVGIAVCEGIGAKSFILAQRSGMVAIGAGSDSQFVSSPDHWRWELSALSAALINKILTFYPDAGSVQNDSVMGKYRQWFAAMADLGYEIKIAWWGQTVKGESPDPDELTADTTIEFISVPEFEAMGNHPEPEVAISEIPWKCVSSHLDQLGSWKTQDLGKNMAEIAKAEALFEEAKTNPNIKYNGERMAQANGSQDAHPVHSFSVFEPMMNLDFQVSKVVESPDGGLLELKISQKQGARKVSQLALIRSTDTTKVDTFVNALKKSLGRNIVCTFKPQHLQALIQNRTAQYQIAGGGIYRLAPRTGRQDDGFWIFEHVQFNPHGQVCTEQESRWLFNGDLGTDEQIVSPKIAAQNKDAIGNLIKAAANYADAETLPLILMILGYGVATSHRQQIMDQFGSFPQINAFGDPGGGKTLAATMACSLFGTQHAPIDRFSESVIFETVKSIGALPLLVDDPLKRERKGGDMVAKVDNFVWGMYNGGSRKVRGNEQKPKTNVIITSNKALGEGTQAVESRLIKINFPVRKFNQAAKIGLQDAMRSASGGIGDIIALKFDYEGLRETACKLTPHLSGTHARLIDNYAMLTHYTQRLCDLAGYEFDALDYCINHLCVDANGYDSDKDSLSDFLEKLSSLRSEGLVGEWNMTQVTKDHKPYLALQLQSIWPLFESRYQVNYSRQSIESLIRDRAGMVGTNQRFVKSKDTWKDFEKALNQFEMGTGKLGPDDDLVKPEKPKKTSVAKCALIPAAVVDSVIGTDDQPTDGAIVSNYSAYPSPCWEPIIPVVEEPETMPEDIQEGTIATLTIDHPEAELSSGDDVIIQSKHQTEDGQWFAVVTIDNEKTVSVWISELKISEPFDC